MVKNGAEDINMKESRFYTILVLIDNSATVSIRKYRIYFIVS